MKYRLTPMDEYPRHQLGGTFDVVYNPTPHWSDGYYFTLGDDAGRVAFFMGLRLYPNNDVMDAFTCVSSAGRQYNMRYSRRLRPRIDDLQCGAISVRVLEPLKRLRITAEPNPYGIAYDLDWLGFTPPYNEDYVCEIMSGRVVHERSNYDQTCDVTGWIEFGGQRFEVDTDSWRGARDHSWGMGATGGPQSRAAAPPVELSEWQAMGLRQWVLFQLPTRSIFYSFHHSAKGEYTTFESQVMVPWGDERKPFAYTGVEHDLEFVPGQRRLKGGRVELQRPDGQKDRFEMEVLGDPVWLEGGGYWRGFDDKKGRGVYRGDEHHEGEEWDVSHPTKIGDPKGLVQPRPDAWAESWGRFRNLDHPEEAGIGHLECVVSGPYPGFD